MLIIKGRKWVVPTFIPLVLVLAVHVAAQTNQATPAAQAADLPTGSISAVVARGQHYKLMERIRQTTNSAGEVTTRTNRVTALANGLNFQDTNGNWIESHPVVQSYSGGIVGVGASYSVILATNLNTAGSVDLETVDHQRIISNPLGLAYYDPDSGKSFLLAQVKDCGAVISSNHILYPDAFTGSGIQASVEYVYDMGHFHQNITLLNQPNVQPADLGMGSHTRLEMLSELVQSPTPTRTEHILATNSVQQGNVVDETLKFGAMTMGLGRAYATGNPNQPGLTVPKQLVNQGGRNILIESVPWQAASAALPPQQSASLGSPARRPGLTRQLPAARMAQTGTNFTARLAQVTKSSSIKLALNQPPSTLNSQFPFPRPAQRGEGQGEGLVPGFTPAPPFPRPLGGEGKGEGVALASRGFTLDYDFVESCTDFNFYDEDATYLVAGELTLEGTTQFSDGLVIKYASFGRLTIEGTILGDSGPFIPQTIFTSMNDDSVGDVIDGSTGSPGDNYTGAPALDLEYLTTNETFAELDFNYCYGGLWVDNSAGITLSVGYANYTNVPGGNAIGSAYLVDFSFIHVCNDTGMMTSNSFAGPNITIGSYSDCNDANSNGIPDTWEYANFGMLVSGTNDYDNDGTNVYQEWVHGTDPNKIVFTLAFTNQFVSTTNTVVTASVSNGVPSSYALLVDSTNTAGATWSSYSSSNLTLSLGSTEGWHSVAVGLRGRLTTSQQTWQWWRLKYDHTPPVLVLTSPVSTVNQPMVQLQGYANEALSSLSYDLTNSNGLATNQQVLVLNHFYDTNTWEFTTNWFQAFDVPLAVGTNVFTLHAADLAGNLTNTNLTVILDYSTRTNPPVITLYWPTNGSAISGSNLTWRGKIDDFTGTVTAQLVDTNGNTNQYPGLVERNGNFWVENLPLTAGTNALTLVAVDCAGNTNQTNLNVTQSSVNLTIDPLSWTSTNTVTGTMDDTNYTVWVNGVKATNTGGSAWLATNVPFEGIGTALVQARAIPNSDNGGNGTGGSGGGITSLDVPGNPSTSNPQDTESEMDRPMGIYYSSYHSLMYEQSPSGDAGATGPDSYWENTQWANGSGGTKPDISIDGGTLSTNTLSLMWPASSWPLPIPVTEYWRPADSEWVADGESGVLDLNQQFGDVPQAWFANIYQFNLHRAARMSLFTGGKAIPGQASLFQLAVSVSHLSLPPLNGVTIMGRPSDYLVPTSLPPQLATVGNFGSPSTEGNVWAMLPAGVCADVTVTVPGDNFDEGSVTPTQYKAIIIFNGVDITDQTTNVVVGQPINLECTLVAVGGGTLPETSNFLWTVPGVTASNFVATVDNGQEYTNFYKNTNVVNFYWISGGLKQITCVVTTAGSNITAQTAINVRRPNVQMTATAPGQIGADTNFIVSGTWLHLGGYYAGTNYIPGVKFHIDSVDMSGAYSFIQTGTFKTVISAADGTNYGTTNVAVDNGNDTSSYTYPLVDDSGSYSTSDSPAEALYNLYTNVSANDSFVMYLMFQRTNTYYPVPLLKAAWSWSASAALTNWASNLWQLTSSNKPGNIQFSDTFSYPEWTNKGIPFQWTPRNPPIPQ